jgi:glycosyltransferase involved in cell wall biosynthesis
MRLLYFATHQIWPLTSGNRLRNFHLARQLARRASVTIVEMCHPGEIASRLPDDCQFGTLISLDKSAGYTVGKILRGIIGPRPLTVLNYFQPGLALQLADIFAHNQFDTVQVQGVHLSEYLPVIRAAPNRPAILVDWHNIESELMARYSQNGPSRAKKLVARRTATLLERTELRLLETCVAHTVPSERERDQLIARCPSARVYVLPNGVDAQQFSPTAITKVRQSAGSPAPKQSLLFVGSMDFYPNIDAVTWFARDIWPEISQKHPELQFVIAGRKPPQEVRKLASDRVVVTGTVDEVLPLYASAVAAVVPLRMGSGTRLKILEAMAAGVPVVSTHLGAEGIDVMHNVHLFLADSAAETRAAIDRIIDSPPTCLRLTQAARHLVATQYDWTVLGEKLFRIHQELGMATR